MAKKTTFGIRKLKEELNSEAFLSGLEAIVKYTKTTGREAGFRAYYSKEAGILVYSDYIVLGDEEYVSGIDFDLPTDAPSILREEEKTLDKRRMISRLDYPQSEDYKMRKERGFSAKETACLISVHTHPGGPIVPSEQDLKSLNATRLSFVHNFDVDTYKARNPVSIIVVPTKGFHPFYIVQENTETPLLEDTDFEGLSNRLYDANEKRILFGSSSSVVKEYNVLYASVYPNCRKIKIESGDKLMPLVR